MRDDRGKFVRDRNGLFGPLWVERYAVFALGLFVGMFLLSFAPQGIALLLVTMSVLGLLLFTNVWYDKAEEPPSHVDLCLACGFKLDGLVEASDGCTVCPECGAAWRRDRTT